MNRTRIEHVLAALILMGLSASFVAASCSHIPSPVGGGVTFDDGGVSTCVTWASRTDAGLVLQSKTPILLSEMDGGAP